MNPDAKNLHGVVIGLGSIGNRHLNNLLKLGVGRMTIVRRENSPNQHFQPPDQVTVWHSLEQALATHPDFAVVCNPSHLHATTAIECLQAGAHVLIEKPLGKDLGPDEQRLIEVVAASDRICAMAYCMRYHPAYRTAREQIHQGAIGRCLYAKAWFEGFLPDWHPWENHKQSYAGLKELGGGVLRTLDHELDFLNWVLGPADAATGCAINTGAIGIEADDLAMYTLRHSEGVLSQITTAFCRKPVSRGFEFIGTDGVLSFKSEQGQLVKTLGPGETSTMIDLTKYDINRMYVELATDFLRSIPDTDEPLSLPLLGHGVHCLRLIEMVDQVQPCPN